VTQAAIAAAFAFLGQTGTTVKGAYDVLISMMVVAVMLPFVALSASAIPLFGGAAVPESCRTRRPSDHHHDGAHRACDNARIHRAGTRTGRPMMRISC
jgi:hypothetical protein